MNGIGINPAVAVSTQKTHTVWSLTKSLPTDLMIRYPPQPYQKAIAAAQATITSQGTTKVFMVP
jgi:hypothetical protein